MTLPTTFESTTPRHGLPLLFPGQAEKEASLNELAIRLDYLVQPIVLGERADPPAQPAEGEAWIIGRDATGVWSGHDREIAYYGAGHWHYHTPGPGSVVFDSDASQLRKYDADWQQSAVIIAPEGGETVDIEARAAIGKVCQLLREAGFLA